MLCRRCREHLQTGFTSSHFKKLTTHFGSFLYSFIQYFQHPHPFLPNPLILSWKNLTLFSDAKGKCWVSFELHCQGKIYRLSRAWRIFILGFSCQRFPPDAIPNLNPLWNALEKFLCRKFFWGNVSNWFMCALSSISDKFSRSRWKKGLILAHFVSLWRIFINHLKIFMLKVSYGCIALNLLRL